MTKPFAWSYSALTSFETCPWRYYLIARSKQVKEPETEATRWGHHVHKALELRIGQGTPLPSNVAMYEPRAAAVIKARENGAKVETEKKYAITASFTPASGYFGHDVWCRSVADVLIEKKNNLAILDWKTGKPTTDSQQLRLSAAIVMAHKPYIQRCTNSFIWLGHADTKPTTEILTREHLPGIWQEFMPRVNAMAEAIAKDKFPKRPSGLCKKHCPVGRALCEHCGG